MPLHTDQMDMAIMNLEQLKLGLRIRDARKFLGYSQKGFRRGVRIRQELFRRRGARGSVM
jgi:hypothetical protein